MSTMELSLMPAHAIVRDGDHCAFRCLCGQPAASHDPEEARRELARHIANAGGMK